MLNTKDFGVPAGVSKHTVPVPLCSHKPWVSGRRFQPAGGSKLDNETWNGMNGMNDVIDWMMAPLPREGFAGLWMRG